MGKSSQNLSFDFFGPVGSGENKMCEQRLTWANQPLDFQRVSKGVVRVQLREICADIFEYAGHFGYGVKTIEIVDDKSGLLARIHHVNKGICAEDIVFLDSSQPDYVLGIFNKLTGLYEKALQNEEDQPAVFYELRTERRVLGIIELVSP